MSIIHEKINQAKSALREFDIDCWITFVRETGTMADPVLPFLCSTSLTWPSALVITKTGEAHAIVGAYDRQAMEDLNVYDSVAGYVESIQQPLLDRLLSIGPSTIAVNFSEGSDICDGLTHGMFLKLQSYLAGVGLEKTLVSSEKVVAAMRQRKTASELDRIKSAIEVTEKIFDHVGSFIRPGQTEEDIARFMRARVKEEALHFAWDPTSCPAVFTGPDTAGAHYGPTDRQVERGHILNMDFGVRLDDYVSDMQRTFYILRDGETSAPRAVQHGFDTIRKAIEEARKKMRPGVKGVEVDSIAREVLLKAGYKDFPHGLGHQTGRVVHDGTALLGPAWEKYGNKPFDRLEENMVFTIEPRLFVEGHGTVTIEEMVVVTAQGADYLSHPQVELMLVG